MELAQLRPGGIVQNGETLQLSVEILPRREVGVLSTNGDLPALQRQGGVHVLYPGQSQKQGGLMDPGGF